MIHTTLKEHLKILYIGLAAILILFNIVILILSLNHPIFYSPFFHVDINVYCAAVSAFENGKNPYLMHTLKELFNSNLPFVYPPLTIPFYQLFCAIDSRIHYMIVIFGSIVTSIYIIIKAEKNSDPILLITLITTGFIGLYMSLLGNFVIFELILMSAMFFYMIRKNYGVSALFLGILSFVKILPLAFSPLYLFIETSIKKRVGIILTCIGSFFVLNFISLLIYPDLSRFYYLAISGGLNQPNSPLSLELNNLSSFTIFAEIGHHFFYDNSLVMYFSYAAFSLIILLLFRQLVKKRISQIIEIYSSGFLVIYLILPKIAPYTFLLATVPIYFLMKSVDTKDKIITLGIVSGLPLLKVYVWYFFPLLPSLISHIFWWMPFYSLLLFYLFYLYRKDILPYISGGRKLDEQQS